MQSLVHGRLCSPHQIGDDEHTRGNALAFEDRKGVMVDVTVAIIEGHGSQWP